jgi:hypothetical protein
MDHGKSSLPGLCPAVYCVSEETSWDEPAQGLRAAISQQRRAAIRDPAG